MYNNHTIISELFFYNMYLQFLICRHAKRSTVSTEDVKLVARRSTALVSYFTEPSTGIKQHLVMKAMCTYLQAKISVFSLLGTLTHFTLILKHTCVRVYILQQTANLMFNLPLFQLIYIQNKSEELNQEQRDLKKKNSGKRKSRDTEEESRE